MIWDNMNQVVFKNKNSNLNLSKLIMQRVREYYHCAYNPKEAETRVVKAIRWEKLTRGWVKLNINGSSLGNPGLAGGGGLIWDENGEWILGFARNIGITTSFQAKLWALCDGLSLFVDRNFSTVKVDLEAKFFIDVLTSPSCSNNLTFLWWMIASCWLPKFPRSDLIIAIKKQIEALIS